MSLIPGKDDEEMAWRALRRKVADQTVEQSFDDDKKRLRVLEDKMLALLQRVDLLIGHYQDLTKAYDRLVTRLEFNPFKTLVFCLCAVIAAVMLILVIKGR